MSAMLYHCMFCVALSMDLFVLCVARLTVFVNCLVKQFAICLWSCCVWLCVVGGALLDRTCVVFHRMCVFACGPSERLDAPSICVVCVFVCRK